MSDTTEAKAEKKPLEHKVGAHRYAAAGTVDEVYVVIGAPRIQGKRWVTVSHINGGPVAAYPEDRFEREFWVPNPPAEDE